MAGFLWASRPGKPSLVDEIGSFQDALEYLRGKTADGRVAAKATFELIPNTEGNEAMDLKSLTIEMLSTERPDLIQEITQKEQAAVSSRVSALEGTVKAQSETIAAQQEKILESEKRETLRAEKEIKLTADGIWKEKLSASKIPVRLHDKVKLHVDHEKFVKDQVLDEAAFAKAVADEVAFFEKEIQPASGDKVLGSPFRTKPRRATARMRKTMPSLTACWPWPAKRLRISRPFFCP